MNILRNLNGTIYVRRYFLLLASNSTKVATTNVRLIGSARAQSTSSTTDRNVLSDEEEARRKAERLLRPEPKVFSSFFSRSFANFNLIEFYRDKFSQEDE